MRPAWMREKSSKVLTSFAILRPLRWMSSNSVRACSSTPEVRARSASTGPRIKVNGVRNSWLMLEKNVVLARSSSASDSARCC